MPSLPVRKGVNGLRRSFRAHLGWRGGESGKSLGDTPLEAKQHWFVEKVAGARPLLAPSSVLIGPLFLLHNTFRTFGLLRYATLPTLRGVGWVGMLTLNLKVFVPRSFPELAVVMEGKCIQRSVSWCYSAISTFKNTIISLRHGAIGVGNLVGAPNPMYRCVQSGFRRNGAKQRKAWRKRPAGDAC